MMNVCPRSEGYTLIIPIPKKGICHAVTWERHKFVGCGGKTFHESAPEKASEDSQCVDSGVIP